MSGFFIKPKDDGMCHLPRSNIWIFLLLRKTGPHALLKIACLKRRMMKLHFNYNTVDGDTEQVEKS